MKKLVNCLTCLMILCGCTSGDNQSWETSTYTYIDTRTDTVKQLNMLSLDTEIETIADLKDASDTIIVASIMEIQTAEIHNERFRTPLTVQCQEVIKGEEKENIYLDGGRMSLADYEPQMIEGYLNDEIFKIYYTKTLKENSYVTIVPVNYVELESNKTYLFFIKEDMIINGGYGVFEKMDDDTYQNVITEEKLQLDQLK